MALTDYTTYDEIRAVLGVSIDELEDETLALPLYTTEMQEGLYSLATGLPAAYAAVKALDPTTTTSDQKRFLALINAWSAYNVSVQLLAALSMFAPKTIESDKDKQERVLDPYAFLRDKLPAAMATYGARILALYGILYPGAVVPSPVAAINVTSAGLGVDPVTG